MKQHMDTQHYSRLALMTALHFVTMYVLMYAMVDRFDNVYASFNQVYMSALMTSPMLIIEMLLMGAMYPKRTWNLVIAGAGVLVLIVAFILIRQQTLIADKQFLRSMIPHHAGAILMAKEAPIQDPEIRELSQSIISSQQKEIDWMKAKLEKLD